MTCGTVWHGEVITMTGMTPGQLRTAAATAKRMRKADEKLAARLRARGWTVVPPEQDSATRSPEPARA
jgi:hypothetical protein